MKIAAAQLPVSACYDGSAIAHLSIRVRECEKLGVALLCCPEGTLGGLVDYLEAPDAVALPPDGVSLARRLEPLASETVTVIVGFSERDADGRYFNAAAVYSRGEVRGVYRKHHPAIRRSRYSPGTDTTVFRSPGGTLGVLICRDSLDAELAESLVRQGAQTLCIPTNNAMPPDRAGPRLVDDVRVLDARYATTFGTTVVRADVIGEYRGLVSTGSSMVTTPGGKQVRAQGAGAGELIVAAVNRADEVRRPHGWRE